ncbi:Gfo/Idh/MocA family oxidoreductase [Kiloniella litopenaei]|uniref:Gfo/Idh/MocA family oxidoreductase n=1 Tax=Kiloniella litopenaei TaxID=1549748 RepID=UPI003BAB7E8D
MRTLITGFGAIADSLGEDPHMLRLHGEPCHALALQKTPRFSWDCVVDSDPHALERAQGVYAIPHCHSSLDNVPDKESYEAAVLTSPAHTRQSLLDTFPNLKAIMLEKPLGPDLDLAGHFLDQCESRNIQVQVNFWRRGVKDYLALAQGSELEKRIGTFQTGFALYGNGLFNNGSHLVDFIQFLLGPIQAVQALSEAERLEHSPIPGDYRLSLALTLASGAVITLQPLDFEHYREVSLDLWGTRGRISFAQECFNSYFFPVSENRTLDNAYEIAWDQMTTLPFSTLGALTSLYDNLYQSVTDPDAGLLSPASAALSKEKLLNQALLSARKGGTIIAV